MRHGAPSAMTLGMRLTLGLLVVLWASQDSVCYNYVDLIYEFFSLIVCMLGIKEIAIQPTTPSSESWRPQWFCLLHKDWVCLSRQWVVPLSFRIGYRR